MGRNRSTADRPWDSVPVPAEQLVDLVPTAVFTVDLKHRILTWNREAERLTGYSAHEVVGQPCERVTGYPCNGSCPLLASRNGRPVLGHECRIRTKSGEERIVAKNADVLRDEHGEVIGGIESFIDVTYRAFIDQQILRQNSELRHLVAKRTAALAQAQTFLSASLSSAPVGIVLLDAQGRFSYVNEAFAEPLHREPRELLGRTVSEVTPPLFRPDTLQVITERVARRLKTGEPITNAEVEILDHDGNTIPVSYSAAGIRDADGAVVGEVVFASDISERKRAENELLELNRTLEARVRQRTAELQAANEELEAFSSSVAHDLRGHLLGIGGSAQVLLEDHGEQLDDAGRGYLERLSESTMRMGTVIEGLLRLSRVGRHEVRRCRVDLSRLARGIAARLRDSSPPRDTEIEIQVGLWHDCDPHLLCVALENLLGNAWKYTSGNRRARIEVGRSTHDEKAVYFVRDNGAGFDMRYVGKLFNPFERLHRRDEFPGDGLGLATVKRIVSRHGGRIWAEGAVGQSAAFYFTLGDDQPDLDQVDQG